MSSVVTNLLQETGAPTAISVLPFNMMFLEAAFDESELKPDSSDEPWVRGVCKVITKNEEGRGLCGTGFLLKFEDSQKRTVYGLLTCHHVATYDFFTRVEPNQISLDFQSLKKTYKLSEIQKEKCEPIFNQEMDFYFVILSDTFCEEMINNFKVQFIGAADSIKKEPIIVPQHPDGKERHIASATIDQSWDEKSGKNWHKVSTKTGSSGAPLLQKYGGEMRVIGINRGYDRNHELNGAISIGGIVNQIKLKQEMLKL